MTSASLEADRELLALRPRRVAVPVVVSVVLHGALLGLVARIAVPPPDAVERGERASVRVIVAPRLRAPEPELPAPEALLPTGTQLPEPEAPNPPEPAPAEPSPAASEAATEESAPNEEVVGLAEPAPGTGTPITGPAWTPARIRSAIDAHAGERRNTATTAWLTECFVEQKEHGTRDCDRQKEEQDYASSGMRAARGASEGAFAGIRRPDRDWRMVQQYMRSNALMEEIAEQGGVAAALANERVLLNNEYMRFFEGNVQGFQGQDPMWQAMNSGFTADAVHGSRLSLPGNVPFRCGRGKVKGGVAPGGVGVSDIVSCTFEFTGFTITRPEIPVEANGFRVVPVVPGSQQ